MKTIFNLLLFLIAFVIGLVLVLSFKIASFIIGILFFAGTIGLVIFVLIKILIHNEKEDVNKNYKFTDDPRFKEKKDKAKEPE